MKQLLERKRSMRAILLALLLAMLAWLAPANVGVAKAATVEKEKATKCGVAAVPIKSLKIGSSSVKKSELKEPSSYISLLNNKKGKLEVSLKKGWKIKSMAFKDGKAKREVRNGSMVQNSKNKSTLAIVLKKKNETYETTVGINKYHTYRLIYGKENLTLYAPIFEDGGGTGPSGPTITAESPRNPTTRLCISPAAKAW